MEDVTVLFRVIGAAEFALLVRNAFRGFPSGVALEPVLYATADRSHAEDTARRWFAADAGSGYVGYVARFVVPDAFLTRYPVRHSQNGRAELWIPLEHLAELNASVIGQIEVVAEFRTRSEGSTGI